MRATLRDVSHALIRRGHAVQFDLRGPSCHTLTGLQELSASTVCWAAAIKWLIPWMHVVPGGSGQRGGQGPGAGTGRTAAVGRRKAVRRTGGVVDHLRLPDVASDSKECEVGRNPYELSRALHRHPHCYMLALARRHHTATIPERSSVLAYIGRSCVTNGNACIRRHWSLALSSSVTLQLLAGMRQQRLSSNSVAVRCILFDNAALQAQHAEKPTTRLCVLLGVAERKCCRFTAV